MSIKYNKLKVLKRFGDGIHAKSVVLLENNIIRKEYDKDNIKRYKKEVKALQKMVHCRFVPKLLKVDDKKNIIYMEYCGKTLDEKHFIKYKYQINKNLRKIRKRYGLYHNDAKPHNICVKDDKIYIIDFSWVSKSPYKKKTDGSLSDGLNSVEDYLNR